MLNAARNWPCSCDQWGALNTVIEELTSVGEKQHVHLSQQARVVEKQEVCR